MKCYIIDGVKAVVDVTTGKRELHIPSDMDGKALTDWRKRNESALESLCGNEEEPNDVDEFLAVPG